MRTTLYSSLSRLSKTLRPRLTMLATALLLAPAAWAQIEVPAGNPNGSGGTTARKPLGTWFGFERSAMIYTAAEIGTSGNLTRVGFYLNSATSPASAPTKIYLKAVTNSTFAAATTVAAEETGATLVYDATIPAASFVPNTWVSVPLSAPFAYNGTSNLEVIVETNAGGAGTETSTSKSFNYSSTGTGNNRAQFWQADNAAPTTTGTLSLFRPNIQLTGLTPLACPPVSGLTVGNFTATTAQVSFTPGTGSTSYTVTYGPVGGTATTITPAPTASPITLTGLTTGTSYTVTVTSNCAGSTTSLAASATFLQPLPNDNPSGAIALPLSAGCTPVNGTNAGATTTTPNGYVNGTNPNASCGIAVSPRDVWYSFTTAASGAGSTSASVQVTGNPAGYLRVFSSTAGAAGPFQEIACASGGAVNTVSNALNLTGLTPNTTYYIFVAGYGSADTTGPFTICVSSTAAIICAAPAAVTVANLTATSANLTFTPGAGNTGYTVTYYPTATPAAAVTVTPAPTASPVALTGLTPNTAYTVTLQALCSAGGTTPLITRTFTTPPLPPANDNCAAATALTVGTTCTVTTTTNAGATASTGVPAPSSTTGTGCFVANTPVNNDVWYSLVVPASGGLTVSTSAITGSSVNDTGLVIYTGTCGTLTEVGCSDDAGTSLFSSTTVIGLTPGATIYARVWSFGTTPTGQFGICAVALPAIDAAAQAIYALGKAPINSAQTVQAVIRNAGASALTNVPVILSVTGANTFTDAKIVPSIAPGASAIVTFNAFPVRALGNNTLTVTTNAPSDAVAGNNTQAYTQIVNSNTISYVNNATLNPNLSVGFGATTTAAFVVRYNTTAPRTLTGITAALFDPNTIGRTLYGVVVSSTGAVLARTPDYVVVAADIDQRKTFPLATPLAVAAGDFYVGMVQTAAPAGGARYFPLATLPESPTRTGTFFTIAPFSPTAGGPLVDAAPSELGIFVIEAQISTILGTNSPELSKAISMYPNPSTGQVTLDIRGAKASGGLQVQVTNMLGQVVHTAALRDNAENKLDFSGLANGLYMLRVNSGSEYTMRQLILTK